MDDKRHIQARLHAKNPGELEALYVLERELKRNGDDMRIAIRDALIALGYLRGDLDEEQTALFFDNVLNQPRSYVQLIVDQLAQVLEYPIGQTFNVHADNFNTDGFEADLADGFFD